MWRTLVAIPVVATSLGFISPALAGKVGPEFQVNTSEAGHQTNPSSAGLSKGRFVVTWTSGYDGFGSGVFGQLYNSKGKPASAEFRVNATVKEDQYDTAVAGLADGGFVATWTSEHQANKLTEVFAQRFKSNGQPAGKEFRVNTRKRGHQQKSSVAGLAKGSFVVIWQSHGQDGDGYGIYGQRFNARGKARGREFRVNRTTRSDQWLASVAALKDGGFVVTWASYDQDAYGIFGQRFNAKARRKGGEFRVNNTTAGEQSDPSVAGLAKGGFVVAWDSVNLDGSETGVAARRYNARGRPKGKETTVNTYKKLYQGAPAVAALAKGDYVVTWESENQDVVDDQNFDLRGVYGQRFKASGKRAGKEFQAPTFLAGRQRYPSVAGLSRGRDFVVTWESDGQDFGGFNIYGQRFDR
ncbi:hypothetical protein [Microbaculum marinum]|uniref:Uncharacterized protein n=1 Tax=Microbaculum marinum TaxID=1764581 RepID=A0AAW9RZ69_9HYPH